MGGNLLCRDVFKLGGAVPVVTSGRRVLLVSAESIGSGAVDST